MDTTQTEQKGTPDQMPTMRQPDNAVEVGMFVPAKFVKKLDILLESGMFGFTREDCLLRMAERGMLHEDVAQVLFQDMIELGDDDE